MIDESTNDNMGELHDRYMKKINKKASKQNGPLKTLIRRSGMTALMVLDELNGIPFENLTTSLYFIGVDFAAKELTRKFEALLELAGVAPEKFVDSIHRDLNLISSYIKANNLLPELFEMASLFDRLRFTYFKDSPQTIHIMNAYQSVILQTLEYLRPSKFDLNVVVCGCSTEGETLTVPDYCPHIDEISYEVQEMVDNGRRFNSRFEANLEFHKIAVKCGYPEIMNEEQLSDILNIDRIYSIQRTSICAYINEFTYDMVPKPEKAFNGNLAFLTHIFLPDIVIKDIELMLTKRAKTLPSNGVLFRFDYFGGGVRNF